MEIDSELQRFISELQGIRERLRVSRNDEIAINIADLLRIVTELREDVVGLKRSIDSVEGAGARSSMDMQDAIADIAAAIRRQETLHHQVREEITQMRQINFDRAAVMALITAHDEIGAIASLELDHSDVLVGQRRNIVQTLSQLGLRQISPSSGSQFDPSCMRSAAQTIPTSDASLNDRVAEVMSVGWELADGSMIIRLPQVRVYSVAGGTSQTRVGNENPEGKAVTDPQVSGGIDQTTFKRGLADAVDPTSPSEGSQVPSDGETHEAPLSYGDGRGKHNRESSSAFRIEAGE